MIDSHCHLDFIDFDDDRTELLERCRKRGIDRFIVPGVTFEGWPRLMEVVDRMPGLYGALGLHPMFMAHHDVSHLEQLSCFLDKWHAIAVGEIGLDFYNGEQEAKAQCELFEAQLRVAKARELPVILHVRKAHDRALSILRRVGGCGGIVHAFAGSVQQAKQYQQLGFLLGVGGAVTYPRASRLCTNLSKLPLELLVLESDAPDMLPATATESRNTPLVLTEVAEKLAVLHGCSVSDIVRYSTSNLERLFPILFSNGKLS